MTKSFFITGSGTDIGKTFVTSLIAASLRLSGNKVNIFKPIATGFNPETPKTCDAYPLFTAAKGYPPTTKDITDTCPWRFLPAISPHFAAERVGRIITANEVAKCCHKEITKSKSDNATLLIEGIGGVMVPLSYKETTLNLMKAINIPTILVVGSYLGSISHSLSAINALENQNIKIAAIIVNQSDDNIVSLPETATTLRQFISKDIALFSIPRLVLDVNTNDFHDNIWQSLLQQDPAIQAWIQSQAMNIINNPEYNQKQLEATS